MPFGFSWSLLLALAPELVPLIVSTIMSVEQAVRGAGQGVVKKSRVLAVIEAILQTKDFFVGSDAAKRSQIFSLVDQAIDFFVSAFNYLGIFDTKNRASFQPVPTSPETPPSEEVPNENV